MLIAYCMFRNTERKKHFSICVSHAVSSFPWALQKYILANVSLLTWLVGILVNVILTWAGFYLLQRSSCTGYYKRAVGWLLTVLESFNVLSWGIIIMTVANAKSGSGKPSQSYFAQYCYNAVCKILILIVDIDEHFKKSCLLPRDSCVGVFAAVSEYSHLSPTWNKAAALQKKQHIFKIALISTTDKCSSLFYCGYINF